MEKKESPFTAGGNADWYSHYGKQYGGSSRIELPYDPETPFLSIYLKNFKTFICKDICSPIVTIALFTVAKTWREPKCPSTLEQTLLLGRHTEGPETYEKMLSIASHQRDAN